MGNGEELKERKLEIKLIKTLHAHIKDPLMGRNLLEFVLRVDVVQQTEWAKTFVTMTDQLSLFPRTQVLEEENLSP